MDYISALEVSYGSALLAKFNRHTRKDGLAISLAPSSSTPSYLWFARSADETITDVKVLYDDEAVPQGYKKVSRDLSGGGAGNGKVFLAFRTAPADGPGIKPLLAIHLVQQGEAAPTGEFILAAAHVGGRESPVFALLGEARVLRFPPFAFTLPSFSCSLLSFVFPRRAVLCRHQEHFYPR